MPPVQRSKSALCLPSYALDLSTPSTTVASPSPPENLLTSYFTDPEPPRTPNPWIWRCHLCHITYRLGCTRRCLECSHEFCTTLEGATLRAGKKSSRKRGGPCKAEFDYAEWQNYGAWRRTAVLNDMPVHETAKNWGKEADATTDAEREEWTEKKDRLFILRKHDCWQHCDYPSECRHTFYTAMVEGRTAQPSPTVQVAEDDGLQICTAKEATVSDFAEIEEAMQGVDDTTSSIIVATAEHEECGFNCDLSDLHTIGDEDLDPSTAKAFRGRQERRSQLKLARLTGLDSLNPLDAAIDTVSSAPEAQHLLNISSDQQLAGSQQSTNSSTEEIQSDGTTFASLDLKMPDVKLHDYTSTEICVQRSGKGCTVSSQVFGGIGADEWEAWSDSSSSSTSSSLTLTDTDSSSFEVKETDSAVDLDTACPVSHYGRFEDEDMSPVDNHQKFSGERDLIALLRLRNAFMRGDL